MYALDPITNRPKTITRSHFMTANRNAVSSAKPAKRDEQGNLLESEQSSQTIPQKAKDMPRVSSAKPAQSLGFSRDARTKLFQMVDEIEKGCQVWRVDTESKEALKQMVARVDNALKDIKKHL